MVTLCQICRTFSQSPGFSLSIAICPNAGSCRRRPRADDKSHGHIRLTDPTRQEMGKAIIVNMVPLVAIIYDKHLARLTMSRIQYAAGGSMHWGEDNISY